MGQAIEQLGLQTAGDVVGAGMGMLLGGFNDRRQIKQQQKLQDMQIAGQKEMANYNNALQMKMWNDTNYSAQMSQMIKAGVSPGLMYGMGGGGGTTTGSQGGSVSGAQAPSGGGEAVAMAGMGMQNAMNIKLMDKQADVLESQANLNNVEAKKKSGVDTDLAKSQNESILQGVDNLRQDYELKKLDITLKNIQNYEQQASQHDRLDYIEYQTKTALRQWQLLGNEKKISDATISENISRIKAEALGAILDNTLKQENISKTREEIKSVAQHLMIDWDKLSNDNKRIEISKQLKDWGTDPTKHAIDQMVSTMQSIIGVAGKKSGATIINSYE